MATTENLIVTDDVHLAALRLEALDRAVRVNIASGAHERASETVERAKAYEAFLDGK